MRSAWSVGDDAALDVVVEGEDLLRGFSDREGRALDDRRNHRLEPCLPARDQSGQRGLGGSELGVHVAGDEEEHPHGVGVRHPRLGPGHDFAVAFDPNRPVGVQGDLDDAVVVEVRDDRSHREPERLEPPGLSFVQRVHWAVPFEGLDLVPGRPRRTGRGCR